MNGLTINPISDPEELKQSATGEQPVLQSQNNESTIVQPQSVSQTEQSFVTTVDMPVSEQPQTEPVEAPVDTRTVQEKMAAVYSAPTHDQNYQQSGSQKLDSLAQATIDAGKPYSYPVPAGIYVIASWLFVAVGITLYYYVLLAQLRVGFSEISSVLPSFAVMIYAIIVAVGLLKVNRLAYYGAIAGFSLLLLRYLFGMVKTFSTGVTGFNFGLPIIGITVFTSIVYISILVGILVYLTRPKVAGAYS